MANLTSVTYSSGTLSSTVTGDVSTIDNLISSLAAKGTVNDPSADFVSVQKFSAARTNCGKQHTAISDQTQTTIVTAAASTFNDLRFLAIWNTGSTAANCTLRDDTSGTTVAIIAVPAGGVGGFRLGPDDPLYQAAVNKPWTLQADATTTLKVTALFVKNTV